MASMAIRPGTPPATAATVEEEVARLHRQHYRSLVRLADPERAPAYLRSVALNRARTDGSCDGFFMSMERLCQVIERPGG